MVTGNNSSVSEEINIPDPSLSSATAHHYILLVDIGATAVTYGTYRPADATMCSAHQQQIGKGKTVFDIQELLKKDDTVGFNYQQVFISFQADKFTLIPTPLFDAAELHTYGKFQFGDLGMQRMYHDNAPETGFVTAYAQLPAQRNTVSGLFDKPVLLSRPTVLNSILMKRTAGQNDPVLMAYLQNGDSLYLAVAAKGNLFAANQYHIQTAEDCIYFMHAFTETLDIDKSTVGLLYGTESSELDDKLHGILPYFKNTATISAQYTTDCLPPLAEAAHFLTPLFGLSLCV